MKDLSIKSQSIEWLRFVCASAVVLLHAWFSPFDGRQFASFSDSAYDAVRIFFSQGCCRVAVPIFFFISGYLFFTHLQEWNTTVWREKIKRRVKSLLIPYVMWNIIAMLFDLFLQCRFWLLKGGPEPDFLTWFEKAGGWFFLWDTGNAAPYNLPLWFIRNLIVLVVLSPLIFYFVKKAKSVGLLLMGVLYVADIWVKIPGFESSGFMFFTLGAYFSINCIDFSSVSRKNLLWLLPIAVLFWAMMCFTYGIHQHVWDYSHRLFTFFGSFAAIGLTAFLFEKNALRVFPLLSNSAFLIYAAHSFVLSSVQELINKPNLPQVQMVFIIKYLAAPAITVALLVLLYYLMGKWTPKTLAFLTGGRK